MKYKLQDALHKTHNNAPNMSKFDIQPAARTACRIAPEESYFVLGFFTTEDLFVNVMEVIDPMRTFQLEHCRDGCASLQISKLNPLRESRGAVA